MIQFKHKNLKGGIHMSKKKRQLDKAKTLSDKRKQKQAKKAYYASPAAKQKWEDKKAMKRKKDVDE